jgi:hypothetical protein
VSTACFTPSNSTAARDFRQLFGGFAGDRSIRGKRFADRAKLALRAAIRIADTLLQHGCREHVAAVQRRDFPIRDAVERREREKARRARKGHASDGNAVAFEHRQPVRPRAPRAGRRALPVCTGTITVWPSIVTALWSEGPAPPRRLGAPALGSSSRSPSD